MSTEYMEIRKVAEQLTEYASLDGTEWGEVNLLLCQTVSHLDYVSVELRELLYSEIKTNLQYVQNHAVVVETEQTYTRKVKELEWVDY